MDTFHTHWRILVTTMTKRIKRKFSPEFRAEVVKLVIEGGKSSSQVARDHDLGAGLVAHWVKQARVDAGVGPAHLASSAERAELSQARKDLRELRRENDFLKKRPLGLRVRTCEVCSRFGTAQEISCALDVPEIRDIYQRLLRLANASRITA